MVVFGKLYLANCRHPHHVYPMSKEDVATLLLDIGAVVLRPDEPFTWASGIKSPIYCDNRLLLGYPEARKTVRDGFVALIKTQCPTAEVIAGVATAGIPHAAWVAEALNKPMVYIRQAQKDHGKKNQVEGPLKQGQKVVVIEDLISTGGSSVSCVEAARTSGAVIEHCFAIFQYGFPEAIKKFEEIHCKLTTLTDFATLLSIAKKRGKISTEQETLLQKFIANPWKWMD